MRARLLFFSSLFLVHVICVKMLSVAIRICNAKYTWLFWCECFYFFVWMFFILATTILNAFDHFWRQFHDNICCSNNGPLCLLWLRVKPNLLLIRFLCAFLFVLVIQVDIFFSLLSTGWRVWVREKNTKQTIFVILSQISGKKYRIYFKLEAHLFWSYVPLS